MWPAHCHPDSALCPPEAETLGFRRKMRLRPLSKLEQSDLLLWSGSGAACAGEKCGDRRPFQHLPHEIQAGDCSLLGTRLTEAARM